MTLSTAFPENLRRMRQERGLSQERFAECCGISERYLRKLESGNASPTLQTLDKICAGLDIETALLLATHGAAETESDIG